nr:sulfite exporter TauE/SafE family protein [uncultured Pseudomonas sp.]
MHDATFYLLFLLGTFLAAGLVKGVTGMGLPTVAMGLLGTVMAPAAAAAILVVPSFVTNLWQLFSGPALAPLLRRLWPMMLCIVLGTLAASTLLVVATPLWSGFWLGIALIVYALYALLAPALRVSARLERWLSPVVGLATGVVTGATGVLVMPAVPYLGSLNLSRDELVQALGLSFSVSTLALAIGLYWHGAFQVSQLGTSTAAIAPALLGMWLGQRLRARISPVRFRQCFMAFLILLGLELAARPLF